MNDLTLYERIPHDSFSVRILDYPMMHYGITPHWHEHIELHYIFEGSATIKCNEKIIKIKSHDCVIINGNELHEGQGGNCSYGCIILPPEYISDNPVIFENICHDETIDSIFMKIYDAWRKKPYTYKALIKGYIYLLIAHLSDNYANQNLSQNLYKMHTDKLHKINTAVKYINDNFTSPITTEQLASMSHFSTGHFCNIFKETLGVSAKEYIKQLRIEKAQGLLESSDMTATEIALCCGFSDLNYFSRTFRQKNNCTPSEYRAKSRLA